MLNEEQYLLLKLAEECSEVSKEALKTIQFGGDSAISAASSITNNGRLIKELRDFLITLTLLKEVSGLEIEIPTAAQYKQRVRKMSTYLKVSQKANLVSQDVVLDGLKGEGETGPCTA